VPHLAEGLADGRNWFRSDLTNFAGLGIEDLHYLSVTPIVERT
jgi:hypothetical protein